MTKFFLIMLGLLGIVIIASQIVPSYIQDRMRLHACQQFELSALETEDCAQSNEAHQSYAQAHFEKWRTDFHAKFKRKIRLPDQWMQKDGFDPALYTPTGALEIIDAYDVIYNGLTDFESPLEIGQQIVFDTDLEYNPPSFGNFANTQATLENAQDDHLTLSLDLEALNPEDIALIKEYCVVKCPIRLYGTLIRLDDRRHPGILIMGVGVEALQFNLK